MLVYERNSDHDYVLYTRELPDVRARAHTPGAALYELVMLLATELADHRTRQTGAAT